RKHLNHPPTSLVVLVQEILKTVFLIIMKLIFLIFLVCFAPMCLSAQTPTTPADLHRLADDYYRWRNQNYPVVSSDNGLHTWDNRLTDYSLSSILARRLHIKE